jgi:hypothetical protein
MAAVPLQSLPAASWHTVTVWRVLKPALLRSNSAHHPCPMSNYVFVCFLLSPDAMPRATFYPCSGLVFMTRYLLVTHPWLMLLINAAINTLLILEPLFSSIFLFWQLQTFVSPPTRRAWRSEPARASKQLQTFDQALVARFFCD